MVIPDTFGTRGEKKVASYDYYDIAEGTGIKVFYGCGTTDSVGESHILTGTSLYSNPIYTNTDTMTTTNYALKETYYFNLTSFNLPKTTKGTSMIDGTITAQSSGGAVAGSVYYVFTFQHYDGSTATAIGTNTTEVVVAPSGNFVIKSFCIDVDLTEKRFKKGEILRVKVDAWGKRTDAQGPRAIICHDPKNRDAVTAWATITAATNHTSLNFHIPFKLDL